MTLPHPPSAFLRRLPAPPRQAGFSLVEIMIAMSVLTMLASGILSGVLQTRKFTEYNVYHTSAINAAAGYLEQMKTMNYDQLAGLIANPYYSYTGAAVPTQSDESTADPLILNTWNYRDLTINVDESGNSIETMNIWFWPRMQNLQLTSGRRAIQMWIYYMWDSPADNSRRYYLVRMTRSYVETF